MHKPMRQTFCFENPGSTTYTMPSIVSDVSAMFVLTTTCAAAHTVTNGNPNTSTQLKPNNATRCTRYHGTHARPQTCSTVTRCDNNQNRRLCYAAHLPSRRAARRGWPRRRVEYALLLLHAPRTRAHARETLTGVFMDTPDAHMNGNRHRNIRTNRNRHTSINRKHTHAHTFTHTRTRLRACLRRQCAVQGPRVKHA